MSAASSPKKWYTSHEVWVNISSFLVLAYALFVPGGEFADLLSPIVLKYIGLGVALLNLYLRVFVTKAPIEKSLT
jgi:hypothetical protein